MGDLKDPVREENRRLRRGHTNLGILLEEKTFIADLEHKDNARVMFLYTQYLLRYILGQRYAEILNPTRTCFSRAVRSIGGSLVSLGAMDS